jgi:FkbM family methyltransferase
MISQNNRVKPRRDQLWTRAGGIKNRILDFFYGKLTRFTGPIITYNGVKIDVSAEAVTEKIRASIARGAYEQGEQKLITEYINPEDDVIELGGGLGFIATFTNIRLSKMTTHLVIEANPRLRNVINRTRELNQASFELISKAYHPTEKRVSLYLHPHFWSNSTVSDTGKAIEVETVNLQQLADEYSLEEFSLVVDIEGAEVGLAEEMTVLESHCKLLIVEFHDTKSEHQSVADEIQTFRKSLEQSSFKRVANDETKGVYLNTRLTGAKE